MLQENLLKRKHVLSSITLSSENRAGQATSDDTEHAHCMLDTLGYKHTVRISNT